jgi:ubiquinone/menaquinone biosynthesis C-methylase UbiE
VFLPLYDPLQRAFGGDAARAELIREAALLPGHRVLDIGCGTGSLLAELGRLHPEVVAVGLDPDPKALARARRKIERAGGSAQLDRGFADDMPYASGSFDRVFSSLMFHHLGSAEKKDTLAEVARVLAPGGELHLLDLVHAARPDGQRAGFFARMVHSHAHDHDAEGIAELFVDAGFLEVREVSSRKAFFVRIANFSGKKPSEAA